MKQDPAQRILDAIEPLIREAQHHAIATVGLETLCDVSKEDVDSYERLREVLGQIAAMLDGYRTAMGEDPIHPSEEDLKV